MDKRATESLMNPAMQMGETQHVESPNQQSQKSNIPVDLVTYIEEHQLNQVVKVALNKVLRERPADPFSALAV